MLFQQKWSSIFWLVYYSNKYPNSLTLVRTDKLHNQMLHPLGLPQLPLPAQLQDKHVLGHLQFNTHQDKVQAPYLGKAKDYHTFFPHAVSQISIDIH